MMYYLYPDPSRIGAPSFIQLSNPLVLTVYIQLLQGNYLWVLLAFLRAPTPKPRFLWLALYISDLSTKNLENRLPFDLKGSATTHFEGFVELSSLLIYLELFGFCKMI